MTIPGWFEEELHRESDGRYRVRWSPKRSRFQVEEKVARKVLPRRPIESIDDDAIRATDGYALVMEVCPGDRTQCPRCGRSTHVTKLRVATSRCEWCQKEFRAFFWPLSDSLLQHLRYINPDRGGWERVMPQVDQSESRREAAMRRARHNATEAIWKEDFNRAFDIQSVGYTGRERMWQRV